MGKSSKAPDYATATYNTGGLFGSSTASKKGVDFTPNAPMTNIGNTAWQGWQDTLNSLQSGDYSQDANYQVYRDNLNRQMQQNYDSSVLSNLANRGLMRSSGLQGATNAFADTLTNQTANLYDSYTNRLNTNLANYQNTLNNLYNYITGVNSGAQNQANNVSNYNLSQAQLNNSNNSALWNNLAEIGGTAAGAAIMASDKNVKKDIVPLGKRNGFNWYEFEYKNGFGLPSGKHYGVIAQEVEKTNPDAVVEINGIKHVNYSKLGLEKEVA